MAVKYYPKSISVNIQRGNAVRKEKERKIRAILRTEPHLSVNQLAERIGGSACIVGTIFNKIRRKE